MRSHPNSSSDERRPWLEQRGHAVEPVREVTDVVQRAGGDDRVEAALVILEVLEPDAAEEISLRRERVDPEHVVPRDRERRRQLALTAAHVEHACGRGRKVVSANSRNGEDEGTMVETTVSATAVRRLAVAAQGYSSRYRRATDTDVEAAIRRLSCVQLDSISTVERSHRIALTSRVGNYPREAVSQLLGEGRIFEFWAHEACLLPIESWPLFRRAMVNGGRDWYSNVNDVKAAHPQLADEILGRIRERRPARVPAVRGGCRRRHVELEAGEGDARAALEPR